MASPNIRRVPRMAEKKTRRHETIAGQRVTIIKRGHVETVRGGPRCRWCGKPLRPQYRTKRASETTDHYYSKQPRDIPATYDADRQQWKVASTVFRVVKRVFQGSFGMYGDNYFCGLNCGRDYAVALTDALTKQQLRLVDKSGKDAQLLKEKLKRSRKSDCKK